MLSVIIATLDSERALVPTLAALVPGATAGVVSEVLIADGGSRDDTATVADVTGCTFIAVDGPVGRRLKVAAAAARARWLLFLRPGTVLDAPWIGEVVRFVEQRPAGIEAAVFRAGAPAPSPVRQIWDLLVAAGGGLPRPGQGLLTPKPFYQGLGGHAENAADAEADLLRRIGRRRIATLRSSA